MKATKTNLILLIIWHSIVMRLKFRLIDEITVNRVLSTIVLKGINKKYGLIAKTTINLKS